MHAWAGFPGNQSLSTGGFDSECFSVARFDAVVPVLVERPIHEALRAARS